MFISLIGYHRVGDKVAPKLESLLELFSHLVSHLVTWQWYHCRCSCKLLLHGFMH